jgi:four helix bundle protein
MNLLPFKISRKEARETLYWLRLLQESDSVEADKLSEILKEADELVRILTAIVKTAQTRSASGTNDEG